LALKANKGNFCLGQHNVYYKIILAIRAKVILVSLYLYTFAKDSVTLVQVYTDQWGLNKILL